MAHRIRLQITRLVTIAILATGTGSMAHAACFISVGNAEAPTKRAAVMLARQDAVRKAGGAVPRNAEYSEPACYASAVYGGASTFGCEVQLSYCTTPALPAGPDIASGPIPSWPHQKKHRKWSHGEWHSGGWKGHASISAGGWIRGGTAVSCLRFNAKATGRSQGEAMTLVSDALLQSIAANAGASFDPGRAQLAAPVCAASGGHRVTCTQSARYCH